MSVYYARTDLSLLRYRRDGRERAEAAPTIEVFAVVRER